MGDPTNTLNQAKVITAQAMLQEGYITQEQFTRFVTSYAFVYRGPGMWDKIMERIWGRPEQGRDHYDLVKMVVGDDDQAEALRIVENIGRAEDKIAKQLEKHRFERIEHEPDESPNT